MHKVLNNCPVCNSKLTIERLKCDKCKTVIENRFHLSKFDYFNEEQQNFIETFIRCSGSIKDVEKALGISYPTVKSKLNEIIAEFDKMDKKKQRTTINPEEIFDFMDPSKFMDSSKFMGKSPEDIQSTIEDGMKQFKNGIKDILKQTLNIDINDNDEKSHKVDNAETANEVKKDKDVSTILEKLERGEIDINEALKELEK